MTPRSAPGQRVPLVAGVPLGAIVRRTLVNDPGLVMVSAPRSTVAERYRALVARLEQLSLPGGKSPQIIVITSSVPAEGKTMTAVNLALALAERRDRTTLLLDADLRRPAVSRYLTPAPKIGLSEVLSGGAPVDHAFLEIDDVRLTVLPSGSPNPTPLELLRSDYLGTLFDELRRRYDRVVVDTPPAVPFADAGVINTRADGALLVVRAGQTPKPMVDRALDSLDGGMILGAVLNDVHLTPVDRYYYQYDDYDPDRYSARGGA
jgi:receptor protein-tyrosine kinase/non-specific protein-tyrosine kinase